MLVSGYWIFIGFSFIISAKDGIFDQHQASRIQHRFASPPVYVSHRLVGLRRSFAISYLTSYFNFVTPFHTISQPPSLIGLALRIRSGLNLDRSIDGFRPIINSDKYRPTAGACCRPCPEKPFARKRPFISGHSPRMAF